MSFYEGFDDREDISNQFNDGSVLDYRIIIAVNVQEMYEGDSYILAEKDGRLYENEAGHCSCYGFENQWDPSEVTIEYLFNRVRNGRLGLGFINEQQLQTLLAEFLVS